MREPKNQMLGTMEPPLMQLSVKGRMLHAPEFNFIISNQNFILNTLNIISKNKIKIIVRRPNELYV